MRVWRMSLWRMKSAIISWHGTLMFLWRTKEKYSWIVMKYPPFLGYPRLTGARKCHPTPGGVRQLSCMTSRQLSDGKMSVFDVIFCHNDCSVRVENSSWQVTWCQTVTLMMEFSICTSQPLKSHIKSIYFSAQPLPLISPVPASLPRTSSSPAPPSAVFSYRHP